MDDAVPTTPRQGRGRAILLTCYMTGATTGNNLGTAGYSYDFVAQLFIPLLSRFGKVIPVPQPATRLDVAVEEAREAGLDPVHVSFLPFQDVTLSTRCPNVVVPAWEFPDVPDEGFDANPQNNWPATANRCAGVWVGGAFTLNALRKSGTECPVHIVPVPSPDAYFQLPLWTPGQSAHFPARSFGFPLPESGEEKIHLPEVHPRQPSAIKRLGKSIEAHIRRRAKRALGQSIYRWVHLYSHAIQTAKASLREAQLPIGPMAGMDLSGVVYSTIFNPTDGRKNWTDLLTAFLIGLADCEDATLVVKLITSSDLELSRVIRWYLRRGIRHRCNLYIIPDYLTSEQLVELAAASTYYCQATRAEGNCLPLMNYLAAGRPAVTPCHSAIADYFSNAMGFMVESHPEPSAWPHERQLRIRSTWARIVWPSLVEQFQASYHMAKNDLPQYYAKAEAARTKMAGWASERVVVERLEAAFAAIDQTRTSQPQTVELTPERRAA